MTRSKALDTPKNPTTARFKLPFPPTVNHYYRRVGYKTLISKEGRAYRATVVRLIRTGEHAHNGFLFPAEHRLNVEIQVWVPDKLRRDIDNLPKALLDSLQHAGVFKDDSQIDRLLIERMGVRKGGAVAVTVSVLEAP